MRRKRKTVKLEQDRKHSKSCGFTGFHQNDARLTENAAQYIPKLEWLEIQTKSKWARVWLRGSSMITLITLTS